MTVYNPTGGGIQSIVAGTNITVNNTDPLNPIVSATGGGAVTSIATSGLISGGTITTTGTITTSMATNKLVGRGTAGTGVMEEITLGTNLSLTGTTLNATGGGTPAGSNGDIQYNNSGAFGGYTHVPIASGGFGYSNEITTFNSGATQHNFVAATNVIRLTGVSAFSGIVSASTARRIVFIINHGNIAGTAFLHESASSTEANRFSFPNNITLIVPDGNLVEFIYNTSTSRWNLLEIRNVVEANGNAGGYNLYTSFGGKTIGVNNTVYGVEAIGVAGASTYNGTRGIFIGYQAGKSAVNPNDSTVIGARSGLVLTGNANTILGSSIAPLLTSGINNLYAGQSVAPLNTTGGSNVGLGSAVFPNLTTGANNVAIGNGAGGVNTTGINNIYIGNGAGARSTFTALQNSIAIGLGTKVGTSNTMLLGGTPFFGTALNVGINVQSPIERLDVGGNINISGVYKINGVTQSPWLESGNSGTTPGTDFIGTTDIKDLQIKTNNTLVATIKSNGITGFQQTIPQAVGHFGTVSGSVIRPASASMSANWAATGFSLLSGDKNYSIYTVGDINGTEIVSPTSRDTTMTEPNDYDGDTTSGVATSTPGSGYDPNSVATPTYEVWALFDGDTIQSLNVNTFITDGGSWIDTSQNQDVNLSWTAPVIGIPSSYYIVRDGADFVQISGSSPSFFDDNTLWASGGAPAFGTPTTYTYTITYPSALDATGYRILNTTDTTYIDTALLTTTDDNSSWTGGTPVLTPTSAVYPSLKSDGAIQIDSIINDTGLAHGTYTPTATNVTNITSSTPNNATYNRLGDIITVFGTITVTNTLAAASQVDVSLPVASNLGAVTDLNGVATMDSTASVNLYIKGDTTNDRASICFTSAGVGQTSTIYYSFQYRVI